MGWTNIFCKTLDVSLKILYTIKVSDAVWFFISIAQSVEQLIRNQQVSGSSPLTSSKRVEII